MPKHIVAVGRLLPVKGRVFESGIGNNGREAHIEYVDENDIKRSAYRYISDGSSYESFDSMSSAL